MNIYEQQDSNKRNTALLLCVFVMLFLAIGLGFDFFMLGWKPAQTELKQTYNPENATYTLKPVKKNYNFIPYGTVIALIVGIGMAFYGYSNGKTLVLRSSNAFIASKENLKEQALINVVEEVALAAGLPRPAVYVVPDPDPNAFAAGTSPEDSVIAVTQGLLDVMTREELAGVVAHEMSHIRNYDIRLMTAITALVGAVNLISDFVKGIYDRPSRSYGSYGSYSRSYGMPAGRGSSSSPLFSGAFGGSSRSGSSKRGGDGGIVVVILFIIWILLIIFAPMLTAMLKMAVSRQREYLADASAAELTRNPKGLISALEKIYAATGPTASLGEGVSHLCIMDPRGSLIEEQSGFLSDLMATHPPMQKRILALKAMAYMK